MKALAISILLAVVLCLGNEGLAWDEVADFECAATNALADASILVSVDFGNELTNYISVTTNHESQVAAKLVLGERYLACYNETLDAEYMRNALNVASNAYNLTSAEFSSWYNWHARLLLSSCLARNSQIEQAYNVASNAVAELGAQNITTDHIVSRALLKHNKVQDLSIRQAIIMESALFAAMLKRSDEAATLAIELPNKYREMVNRLSNSNEWMQ